MNRGFAFYFKNAIKSSATTVWKSKSILSVWAYFLAELVARITIIFSAVFDLADVRQGKIVDENRKMDIPQTLQVATKGKPVWTMVLSIIAEAFIFLGGALIIAAITAVLGLIGFAVAWLVRGPQYMIWFFCAPGGLLLVVYAVIMVLIFSPTPYIIETNPELGVYETIKICFDSMKGRGKGTAFLNFFIPTLLELIVIGFCAGGAWAIMLFVPFNFMPVVFAVWCIISLALMLMLLPMFDLAKKVAQKSLFADIVLDPVNANKRTSGINIKNCTGVKFDKSDVRDNLVALFDETQSDSVPEPDSPARKKIKELAEKEANKTEKPIEPKKEEVKEVKEEESGKEPPAEEVQPAEVAQPTAEPSEPVEPVQPVEPAQPTEVQPQPAEPVEPVQSVEPQPAQPADEQPAPEKPKITGAAKSETEQAEEASSEEGEGEEKSKKTSTRKKRVKISG